MKIFVALLTLLALELSSAAQITVNPDGTSTIVGVVEQIIPIENSSSIKVKSLKRLLLIQNLTFFSEKKLSYLSLSLEANKPVTIRVTPEFKIIDIGM